MIRQMEILRALQDCSRPVLTCRQLSRLLKISNPSTASKWAERLIACRLLAPVQKGQYLVCASGAAHDFDVANCLYAPSYVSLESALNLHGILLQTVREVVSVTTRRPRRLKAGGRDFVYLHLDPRYYFGYEKNGNHLIADPEKAVVDSLYFAGKGRRSIDLEEWDLSRLNVERLERYIVKIPHRPFQKAAEELRARLRRRAR